MAKLKVPVTQRDHSLGPANARITLVEYGDYECPHCARAHSIVGAGAVVTRDVPEYAIAAGVPARVTRDRREA